MKKKGPLVMVARFGSGKSFSLVLVGLLLTLGLLFGLFEGSGSKQAVPSLGTKANATLSTKQLLDQLAVNIATADGNTSASTATWVATTRASALTLMGAADSSSATSSNPVWIVEVEGGVFPPPPRDSCPPGRQCHLPTYTSMLAIVDQASGNVTDSGVSARAIDLSSIGAPETDSLAGIQPTVR